MFGIPGRDSVSGRPKSGAGNRLLAKFPAGIAGAGASCLSEDWIILQLLAAPASMLNKGSLPEEG